MPDAHDKAAREAHLRAAEQHNLAAQAHRTAAEHNEKGIRLGRVGIRNAQWNTRITLSKACKGSPQQVRPDGDYLSYVQTL